MSASSADSKQGNAGIALPPRKETILAYYPRNLKIGASLVLACALAFSWVQYKTSNVLHEQNNKIAVAISGADSRAAIANQAPAPIPGTVGGTGLAGKNANSPASAAAEAARTASQEENDNGSNTFLVPAPDPGLIQDTAQGGLPRIGEDGRQPWQIYARPFNTDDKRPRVAIVITDLGLARVASDAAITRLPPNVTLAFDVQSPVVGAWCARARQAGHETILQLPMEPFDYPRSDPGPNTILSNLPNADNIQRMLWALAQANGYVGITTVSGTRFTTEPEKITPILQELHKRGLMIFDARIGPHSEITDLARRLGIPTAVNTQRLDQNLSPEGIDESLSQLEQTARLSGHAVGMAPSLPVIIDRLVPWIKQLPHDGIALAPLSAMTQ